MHLKSLSFSPNHKKENVTGKPFLLGRIFRWQWISVLLLGITANLLINAVLDYKYQRPLVSFSLEEYFNALIGAWFFLKGTRWIARMLDKRMTWEAGVAKRLITQLSLQLVYILVALNVLLISITYFIYGGFYTVSDLILINVSVVSITFFFSAINTGIYFYHNWKRGSTRTLPVSAPVDYEKPIQITLGKVSHLVPQQDIQCAVSQAGSSIIITKEERKLIYSESLDALMKNLDPKNFFRANRQTIVHYDIIKSVRRLEHGKIEASLKPVNGQPLTTVISRTKAAEFRRWLKAQSA
ncbi:MAG: hypothetical protein Roseis3KO_18610 [Roseivirga sp.]